MADAVIVTPLCLLLTSLPISGLTAVKVNGAGASFPADVYSAWMPAFKAYRSRFTTVTMTYESIGSGGGKRRIKGEADPPVEYAGSDSLLSDSDYTRHPDLQMFPSIAGPIVIAFNLPGITTMNLKMEHVVGIYSGDITSWNDTRIAQINPTLDLPNEKIRVVARREKSGTTEIFTTALAAVSDVWANSYGVFSKGVDSDDQPHHWNASVVSLFGQTNRGVSGLILSAKYSIGYLVMSDAKNAKLSYAKLQNAAGNIIEATSKSVQSAMHDFAGVFTEHMTSYLANPSGPNSYPISGYTYLIVKKTTMTECNSAIELVRYIEWFYTNPIPRQECENLYMVPLSEDVYNMVLNKIIRKMTCNGKNIYDLVLEQIAAEELSLETWRTPVYVGSPVLAVTFILMFLYLIRNQIIIHKELLKNKWLIAKDDIKLGLSQKSMSASDWCRSRNKIHPSEATLKSSSKSFDFLSGNIKVGHWKGKNIQIDAWSFLSRKDKLSLKARRTILWMRNSIGQKLIVPFYGVTVIDDGFYSGVSEYCSKGSLQDLVRNVKLDIDKDMKYALTTDVAKGMLYLYNQGITHGCLTSKCCYLDTSYTVKIGDWQRLKLAGLVKQDIIQTGLLSTNDWDMPEFWTAPELLRMMSRPSERSDVYSFSIVMQEIFSRDSPYAEHMDSQQPNDIIQAVMSTSLRPVFTPETPVAAREIMERCWEMDPCGRPPFSNIYSMLKTSCPRSVSVIDCMMEKMEEYTRHLEDRLQESQFNDHLRMEPHRAILYGALPPEIAINVDNLTNGIPETFDSASVMVSVIHGFADLVSTSSAEDISRFLSDWYTSLDCALSDYQVHKFDETADTYMVVCGLPTRRNDHAVILSRVALSLLLLTKSFTVRHNHTAALQMRIGICSGPGMAGILQPRFLMKYSVFGKTVDSARVLANTTPPMTIHLAETTTSSLHTTNEFTVIPAQPIHDETSIKTSYWLIGSRQIATTFPPP